MRNRDSSFALLPRFSQRPCLAAAHARQPFAASWLPEHTAPLGPSFLSIPRKDPGGQAGVCVVEVVPPPKEEKAQLQKGVDGMAAAAAPPPVPTPPSTPETPPPSADAGWLLPPDLTGSVSRLPSRVGWVGLGLLLPLLSLCLSLSLSRTYTAVRYSGHPRPQIPK
ncbi:hypothetical protein LZ30DRAFT_235177 [Colletotrichum cereale]|nr:hypothetical protein LZ30DRAFT_235177 [Colletotrichum cereale]